MGVRAVWLADAARLTGYPVLEIDGWRGRGHGDFRLLEGVVLHHTADGPTGNYPSLGVVRDGRAGLRGPLANLGLARDGTVLVIADGVGWHAGASSWAGFRDLNDEFLGIEAESRGTVDDWTPAQRDCYPRLVAACLYYLRRGADRAAGHKEVALPRGRKIDPAFWDLARLRTHVAHLLGDPLARIPRFAQATPPPPTPKDDTMTPEQVWHHPIPDFYGDGKRPPQGAFAMLGWAAAHAARARDEAAACRAELAKLRAELADRPAATVDVDALAAQIVDRITAAGIADAVLDALSERLAPPA